MNSNKTVWKVFSGIVCLALVSVFSLAPTGKTGMLSGRLTTVFSSVTVPTLTQGDGAAIYGGTQTISSSDRFGVGYHIDEGTSTGHIQFQFAVSFDDPSTTDRLSVSNWINGDTDINSDFSTDDSWAYANLPATNTVAPWIRFEAIGANLNATNTTVDLKFYKQ